MWVGNEDGDSVSVFRVSDRSLVKTITVGDRPLGMAFDGANMWITIHNDDLVTKR
jgi:YVTN family beta-propeller protein